MRRPHLADVQTIELALIGGDRVERTERFPGMLIVECNSGPHKGTKIYVDDAGRFIGYDTVQRTLRVFERELTDDEIESYCDTGEEFLAAMLKLGRQTGVSY